MRVLAPIPLEILLLAVFALFAASASSEGIPFDKLSNCSDMSAVVTLLNGSVSQPPRDCRPAGSDAEKRMLQIFVSAPGSISTCWLRLSPAPQLDGFSCLVTAGAGRSASLDCFRPMSAAALDAYFRDYLERYAVSAKAYGTAAGQCPSFNNDVGDVRITTLPPAIAPIAKFGFAFGGVLRRLTGEGMATHGFARTDPALGMPGGAIEYVSAFVNDTPTQRTENSAQSRGEWTVTSDPMEELLKALNRSYRQADAYVNGVSFAIRSTGTQSRSDGEKSDLRHSWQEQIIWKLEESGFHYVPEKELRGRRVDLGEWRQRMVEAQPYGQRDLAARRADDRIFVLLDENSPCTGGGRDGARMGVLMGYKPAPGVVSEYGQVAVFVIGAGRCGRGSGRTSIDHSIEQISETFPSSLGQGE